MVEHKTSWLGILSNVKDLREDTKRLLAIADKMPSEKTLSELMGKLGLIEKVIDKIPNEATLRELTKSLGVLDKKQLASLIKTLDKLSNDGTIPGLIKLAPQLFPLLQNLPDAATLRELLDRLKDIESIASALNSEE